MKKPIFWLSLTLSSLMLAAFIAWRKGSLSGDNFGEAIPEILGATTALILIPSVIAGMVLLFYKIIKRQVNSSTINRIIVTTWLILAASNIFLSTTHDATSGHTKQKAITLEKHQKDELFLYAELKNGYITGKLFNQNPNITVTQITIEAIPKDKNNPFGKYTPRFFNVNLIAKPRIMSFPFEVETGALNPKTHSLQISDAKGVGY